MLHADMVNSDAMVVTAAMVMVLVCVVIVAIALFGSGDRGNTDSNRDTGPLQRSPGKRPRDGDGHADARDVRFSRSLLGRSEY